MKKWLLVWLTFADPLDGVVRHFEDRQLLQLGVDTTTGNYKDTTTGHFKESTTGNFKESTTSPSSQPANHPIRAPSKKRAGSLWPWPVEPPNLTREALICALNTELKGLSGERAITDYLLCVSCPDVPPYDQRKGKVMVGVGLRMLKIKDFNLFTGELVITVWLRLFWQDDRLWYRGRDHSDFWLSSQDFIPMKVNNPGSETIWLPDVRVSNSVNENLQESSNYFFDVMVFDGAFMASRQWNVLWSRLLVFKTRCSIYVAAFPFDTQYCHVKLQSWTQKLSTFHFALLSSGYPPPIQFDLNVSGEIFDIRKTDIRIATSVSEVNAYMGHKDILLETPQVNFFVRLQRKPHYYIVNFVWPLLLVCFFGYLSFWLPFYWYDRIVLSVSIVLTVFAVMLFTANARPPMGDDTWLDIYQAGCIVLCTVPAIETVVISHLRDRIERLNEIARARRKLDQELTSDPLHHAPLPDPVALPLVIDRLFQVVYPGFLAAFILDRLFAVNINSNAAFLEFFSGTSTVVFAAVIIGSLAVLWSIALLSHFSSVIELESHDLSLYAIWCQAFGRREKEE